MLVAGSRFSGYHRGSKRGNVTNRGGSSGFLLMPAASQTLRAHEEQEDPTPNFSLELGRYIFRPAELVMAATITMTQRMAGTRRICVGCSMLFLW